MQRQQPKKVKGKTIGGLSVKKIKCLNERQQLLEDSIINNEVTIAVGEAGTGKTFVAVSTALNLLGGKYKRIVLCKSVTVVPNEELGFLPGDANKKMEPFMMSYSNNIDKLCGKGATQMMIESGLIEVLPLAYVRGMTIDDAIVIIDEVQNIDKGKFKTIVTRIGTNSKYILLGDIEQIDIKDKTLSCLETVLNIFRDSEIVGTVEFELNDCVRNPIIKDILTKLKENGI